MAEWLELVTQFHMPQRTRGSRFEPWFKLGGSWVSFHLGFASMHLLPPPPPPPPLGNHIDFFTHVFTLPIEYSWKAMVNEKILNGILVP